MTKEELIAVQFRDILEYHVYDEELIAKYFDKQYTQYVDGKVLNYEMFCQHIKALKSKTRSLNVNIQYCVGKGDEVFTNHLVTVVDLNGQESVIKVLAYFRFLEDKVVLCDELTFHLEGDLSSSNLGSVME